MICVRHIFLYQLAIFVQVFIFIVLLFLTNSEVNRRMKHINDNWFLLQWRTQFYVCHPCYFQSTIAFLFFTLIQHIILCLFKNKNHTRWIYTSVMQVYHLPIFCFISYIRFNQKAMILNKYIRVQYGQ